MKTTIVTIAAMFFVAWALNESVAPAPDNLLMMNVEALAGPGGGGESPENPGDGKQYFDCWEQFVKIETPDYYRQCVTLVQARSGAKECLEFYAKYKPVDSSKKTCYKPGKNPEPAQ